MNSGGETGIRTQDGVAPMPVFKTGAFNRSAISPLVCVLANNQKFSTKKLFQYNLYFINNIFTLFEVMINIDF